MGRFWILSELIPSKVWLPKVSDHHTTLSFLQNKFPQIPPEIWVERMKQGKIQTLDKQIIKLNSSYIGDRHIIYFREIKNEKKIPFKENILYEDENIILVDKPHFLPVHPAGSFVKETLVHRLRTAHNNKEIAPLHRIDRLTAGLILFSKREKVRKHYQTLFENRLVQKTYHAISSKIPKNKTEWHIKNRIEAGEPWFTSRISSGVSNSESYVNLIDQNTTLAKFSLSPVSGKKHQLRVHLSHVGFPILNDPLYPTVKENLNDEYNKPLQLLAKELSFTDPLSGKMHQFESQLKLLL